MMISAALRTGCSVGGVETNISDTVLQIFTFMDLVFVNLSIIYVVYADDFN